MDPIEIPVAGRPGVFAVRVVPADGEKCRDEIRLFGEPVGFVAYFAIRKPEERSATGFVTHYGWRPVSMPRAGLMNRTEAVDRLLRRFQESLEAGEPGTSG